MSKEIVIALIDGYIDDPAALGVPPYISPMIRSIAGAALDAGADRVEYISIDMIRKGRHIPDASVSVVLSGNTVPGKYLRSMPMSLKELSELTPKLKGWKMISGSAADSKEAEAFDFIVKKDVAASLYDGIIGKEVLERFRTLDEWNRWMVLGADIVVQHQDFPEPLVVEIESYRGCHRYRSGGCSYCIEPMKGKPLMRSPDDILAEARKLRDLGIRNIRIGGQTCIVSYGSEDESEIPRPNPDALRRLFEGLNAMGFDMIHVDNALWLLMEKDPTLNPYAGEIRMHLDRFNDRRWHLAGEGSLSDFANGHRYFGFHRTETGWVFREWLPGADAAWLTGDFNYWAKWEYPLTHIGGGVWEITLDGWDALRHGQFIKLLVGRQGISFERIPAYMTRCVMDMSTETLCGQIWMPDEPFEWTDWDYFCKCRPDSPMIYEVHIGMAQEHGGIGSYREFADNTLTWIQGAG